jgi:glycosyltransferase involved in cell wall biosynthesis
MAADAPHVLQVFERRSGGVPIYVAGLCEGLVARGWRVSVACPTVTVVDERLKRLGIERLAPESALALARRVREGDIALVHAHSSRAGPHGALVARLSRRPSVYTPHGWSFEMRVNRTRRILYAQAELILTRVFKRRVIAVAGVERAAAERWHVAPSDRITVVPTGIPAPQRDYGRKAARSMLGLTDASVVAAWVGRASAQKRPQDLARIAAAVAASGVRIVALGTGLRASSAGQALESAGGIVLAEDTDPQALYAAADVYVQTSAWEGMPLALLEAMTAGLPVVAYDVGGVIELVLDGETGFCAPVGDVETLAERIRQLADDAGLRRRFSDCAREHVAAHHSYGEFLNGIERAYLQCIGAGGMRRKGG